MINRKTICLGLCFFISNIMGSEEAKRTAVLKEIRHAEMARNAFAYTAGLVLWPVTIFYPPISPVINILAATCLSTFVGSNAYLCHKLVENRSAKINQEFDRRRSMAKMAFSCLFGFGTYATLFLL